MSHPCGFEQTYYKKLHVHFCAHTWKCGIMLNFICQKGDAECKHSEVDVGHDQRHKLTLFNVVRVVIFLGHRVRHRMKDNHCPFPDPSHCKWPGLLGGPHTSHRRCEYLRMQLTSLVGTILDILGVLQDTLQMILELLREQVLLIL